MLMTACVRDSVFHRLVLPRAAQKASGACLSTAIHTASLGLKLGTSTNRSYVTTKVSLNRHLAAVALLEASGNPAHTRDDIVMLVNPSNSQANAEWRPQHGMKGR